MADSKHFIAEIIDADIASGKWGPPGDASVVRTRFPPEPNGYLHVGHTKAIHLNFGLARTHGGQFILRFDDTNPEKEEREYVDSIKRDVQWLGADWDGPHGGGLYFASDYFQQMYDHAEELVRKGLAYVCELSAEEVSKRRGTPSTPATSPHRDRPADESLRLLHEMRDGKHAEGTLTLRARIDLASPNFNLRDPVMYRIVHQPHHNTGDRWHIYPMYDWAHGLEDSIEGVTHSLCTLEFENHRPLYDWFINAINQGRTADGSGEWGRRIHHSQQIEFAKLIPTYTVLAKRNLRKMVEDRVVHGWDDPRFPTIAGLRRRGVTPESLWAFTDDIGVTKFESRIDVGRLENAIREHLNKQAPRRIAVLRPLRVVIENFPEGQVEWMDLVNNPEDPSRATRRVPFSRELLIEADDFMEEPPKKFFRLSPGSEVRLRGAYWIRCIGLEKDPSGAPTLIRCTYDPQTRGGESPPDGRKVKATLHWLSAPHAAPAEVRLFDRLFSAEEPGERTGNYLDDLNTESLVALRGARVEPMLAEAPSPDEPAWPDGIRRFQFERLGYFCVDVPNWRAPEQVPTTSPASPLVFNRTVSLKDSWAKAAGKGA
ncbi:MAG: glutamine--tRNA ligase/YqeY domain fusion protein [Phycisphaeraceae bacterium]|nr:glutamine--tRNA ligase/YqeY domain fusion protein [Phycisphaeraceae bacterium]